MAENDNVDIPEGGGSSLPKQFLILALVTVVVGVGAGYGLTQLLGSSPSIPESQPASESPPASAAQPGAGAGEYGYHDFEMESVNINEPRLNRYLKTTFTLAFDAKDALSAAELVKKRDPDLRSWLTAYLANHSLEDLRGKRNINRICREVRDEFNGRLWPDSPALIKEVLIREFIIQ